VCVLAVVSRVMRAAKQQFLIGGRPVDGTSMNEECEAVKTTL